MAAIACLVAVDWISAPTGTIDPALTNTGIRSIGAAIHVYPGKDGEFNLYDDDGASYDYEKGKGATTTTLRWNDATQSLSASDKALTKLVKVIGK